MIMVMIMILSVDAFLPKQFYSTSTALRNSNAKDYRMNKIEMTGKSIVNWKQIVAVNLVCTLIVFPAFAILDDLDSKVDSSDMQTQTVVVSESSRIKRKEELQRKSTGEVDMSNKETGIVNSLQREQQKQQAYKKSKSKRSVDLCESLGRGC